MKRSLSLSLLTAQPVNRASEVTMRERETETRREEGITERRRERGGEGRFVSVFSLLTAMAVVGSGVGVAAEDLPNGFFSDVDGISVALTHSHLCSLEAKIGVAMGGRPVCWGYDTNDILNTPSNEIFVQISVTNTFACGVTLDQRVKCWGDLNEEVNGLYSQIASSDYFACGVLVDGRINCWGTAYPNIPESDRKYVQISCGSTECCALDSEGLPHCWMSTLQKFSVKKSLLSSTPTAIEIIDEYGNRRLSSSVKSKESRRIIDRDESEEEVDEQVPISVQFRQLSVGSGLACGIQLLDGQVRCWGNLKSFLGGNDMITGGPYRQVSVGITGICVISEETNRATCRGLLSPLDYEWDQIKVGRLNICGVTMDSELKCSGSQSLASSIPSDFVVA